MYLYCHSFSAVPVLDYVTFTIQALEFNYDPLLRVPTSRLYFETTDRITKQVSKNITFSFNVAVSNSWSNHIT